LLSVICVRTICYTHFCFSLSLVIVTPSDLLSCPTRRSSDLRLSTSPAAFDAKKLEWINNTYVKAASLDEIVDLSLPHLQEAGLIDRKSTRLNSSHVSISYAVFCLKKKTKHRTPITKAHDSFH